MGKETIYGGGHWTCDKCGRRIEGSSIYHQCGDSVLGFTVKLPSEYIRNTAEAKYPPDTSINKQMNNPLLIEPQKNAYIQGRIDEHEDTIAFITWVRKNQSKTSWVQIFENNNSERLHQYWLDNVKGK